MTKQKKALLRFTLPALAFVSGFFVMAGGGHATYGDVTTFAGKAYDGDGGAATAALLDFPDDVTSDANGNLFIADTFDNAIRKVDTNGVITTLAGGSFGLTNGTGSAAEFALPILFR